MYGDGEREAGRVRFGMGGLPPAKGAARPRYVRIPHLGHHPGVGRLMFYAVACAVCGASAGFVLWWVGVPVTGAALVGLAGAGLVALLIVLVAALSGRL